MNIRKITGVAAFGLMLCSAINGFSQGLSKKVFFIGNSYTYFNNMPILLDDMCKSVGDTFIYNQHTPGGVSLQGHASNASVVSKIKSNAWDYVVLQDQSQKPSLQQAYVEAYVFPFAKKLDSMIDASSNCATTTFFMTWGRKNGDASNCNSFPPVCTYEGMDSMLRMRYEQMASDNKAIVSPVSVVWRYLRNNHPEIELYNPDQSHPSVAGSYAAACCFYVSFYQKDPSKISFDHNLSAKDAAAIREATKLVVYNDLQKWNMGKYSSTADFNHLPVDGLELRFSAISKQAKKYTWSIEASTYSDSVINHVFSDTGRYLVKLTIENDCGRMYREKWVNVQQSSGLGDVENESIKLYPNPNNSLLHYQFPAQAELSLFDLKGSLLMREELDKNGTLDLSDIAKGQYQVIINMNGKTYSKKLHVEGQQ